MLQNVPPFRLFTIASIVAAVFCIVNLLMGRNGWAIAFGIVAAVWGLTARHFRQP